MLFHHSYTTERLKMVVRHRLKFCLSMENYQVNIFSHHDQRLEICMALTHLKGNQSDYHPERLHFISRKTLYSELFLTEMFDNVIWQFFDKVKSNS